MLTRNAVGQKSLLSHIYTSSTTGLWLRSWLWHGSSGIPGLAQQHGCQGEHRLRCCSCSAVCWDCIWNVYTSCADSFSQAVSRASSLPHFRRWMCQRQPSPEACIPDLYKVEGKVPLKTQTCVAFGKSKNVLLW